MRSIPFDTTNHVLEQIPYCKKGRPQKIEKLTTVEFLPLGSLEPWVDIGENIIGEFYQVGEGNLKS
jgi:hypothetical protein